MGEGDEAVGQGSVGGMTLKYLMIAEVILLLGSLVLGGIAILSGSRKFMERMGEWFAYGYLAVMWCLAVLWASVGLLIGLITDNHNLP